MKQFLLTLAIGVALFATSVTAQAATLATYYDSSSRTIYLIPASDFFSPRAYVATKTMITRTCNRNGGMMNLRSTTALSASLQATLKGIAASFGIKTTLPSVYYYNYTSMTQVDLRYNVVATDTKTKKNQQTGWLPDAGNGCTYSVPN